MSSLLSHFPSLKLRSRDTKLRSGKRLHFAASCLAWATEPSGKRQAVEDQDSSCIKATAPPTICRLLALPDELLDGVLADKLDMQDLCAVSQTCTKFRSIGVQDQRWRMFFEERWGLPSDLMIHAAELAGSWRSLYAAKHVMDAEAQPWTKPTSFELAAAVQNISKGGLGINPDATVSGWSGPSPEMIEEDTPRSILFLIDGSGSVTEDDFNVMTSFMIYAWQSISYSSPGTKVGIIQFSNDVRVELHPTAMDGDAFTAHVSKMTRMNGGTNISSAIRKAGQVLGGTKGQGGYSSVVLLTDGRIDGYQASEAVDMSGRLMDEVPGNVSLYAFGVGRGVDKKELLRIIGAGGPPPKESNYMGLCTYEDAPW